MNYTVTSHRSTHRKTGLAYLADRYVPKARGRPATSGGVTLIFAHGTSHYKEQWEPLIDALFSSEVSHEIEAAWTVDWQNHGQSAILNREVLNRRDPIGIEDYGDLLREFVESPSLADKNIVAIGHSGGTAAWTLAVFQIAVPAIPITSFIFFEPVHITQPILPEDFRVRKGAANAKGTKLRRFTFSTRVEAERAIRTRIPWRTWDKRVQESYLKFGFTTDPKTGILTTACSTAQEIWAYEPYVYILAGSLYPQLCSRFPTHLVFGQRPEMYPEDLKNAFSDGKDGRMPASTRTIPGTGHLLVQEKPDECAQAISAILSSPKSQLRSHL